MIYFFLAFNAGLVVRLLGRFGVIHYIKTSKSDEILKSRAGFHISVISYIFGSVLEYCGIALVLAYLVKKYLLS